MPQRPVKSRPAGRPSLPRHTASDEAIAMHNDAVRLSWLQALLRDSGIDTLVLDRHTSLVGGSIGAIPRRLMVAERDYRRACALLAAAGEDA